MDSVLTYDAWMKMLREVQDVPVQPRIVFTANALEATKERLFPASKNRSQRIYKKLIKRFGGEFRMQPCMWRVGDVLYAHPAFKARLQSIPRARNPLAVQLGFGWI